MSRVSNAMGCICRLCSNRHVRSIIVGCRRNCAVYVSARINYQVKYDFYTSNVSNLCEGLAPSRVLTRVAGTRRSGGVEVSGVIVVNVNRPLSGFRGSIGFLVLISGSGKLGVKLHRVSLSASNMIDGVGRLGGCGLPVALSVSLRTPDSTVEDNVVGVGGG